MSDRIPRPGEIYNNFKDKPYQVITVATNTGTGERMVVYQELYGDFGTYVKPLEVFISEADRDRSPEINKRYRFGFGHKEEKEPVRATKGSEESLETTYHGSGRNRPVKERVSDNKAAIPGDKGSVPERKQPLWGSETPESKMPTRESQIRMADNKMQGKGMPVPENNTSEGDVNTILLEFLDANSYTKKLNVITGNIKHLDDRLINDMAVALDCSVEEGPLEERIQGLIFCLKAMCRFEDRRLR